MESKFDWLTLTLKPENPSITFDDCFRLLGEHLLLTDLFAKMVPAKRFAFFAWTIAYENISLSCPTAEKFSEQGICLRISSQGLDFFAKYLQTYKMTLKQWLGEWRALNFDGYISKDTRIDYALDDIHFNGEKPFLTMRKILDCRRKGEMCKKARVVDVYDGSTSVRERYKTVNKEPVVGRTVYVGSRESDVCCRFYDKYAEQLQKKEALPKDCTSWVRCEFEFKGSKAMCVLNAFLDMSEYEFVKYMRGVINNYCSFIVRNNKNISRCSVKRWWSKFLGECTAKFKLPHRAPARSALARAERGLSQYSSILYTMYCEMGIVGLCKFLKLIIAEAKAKHSSSTDGIYKRELAENIRDNFKEYEHLDGVKRCQYTSGIPYETGLFLDKLEDDHWEFKRARRRALDMSDYEKEQHLNFMDGFEVLW